MKTGNNYHAEEPIVHGDIDFYFGVASSGFFFIYSLFPLLKCEGIRLWPVYIGIVLLLLSFFSSQTLTPLRKLWVRLGLLLHKVTQPLILGIIFFVFITPVGILMRFFNKDTLLLKQESGAISYWKMRNLHQVNADMNNQF